MTSSSYATRHLKIYFGTSLSGFIVLILSLSYCCSNPLYLYFDMQHRSSIHASRGTQHLQGVRKKLAHLSTLPLIELYSFEFKTFTCETTKNEQFLTHFSIFHSTLHTLTQKHCQIEKNHVDKIQQTLIKLNCLRL